MGKSTAIKFPKIFYGIVIFHLQMTNEKSSTSPVKLPMPWMRARECSSLTQIVGSSSPHKVVGSCSLQETEIETLQELTSEPPHVDLSSKTKEEIIQRIR